MAADDQRGRGGAVAGLHHIFVRELPQTHSVVQILGMINLLHHYQFTHCGFKLRVNYLLHNLVVFINIYACLISVMVNTIVYNYQSLHFTDQCFTVPIN